MRVGKGSKRFSSTAWLALGLAAGICQAGCRGKTELTPEQAAGKHLYQVRCAHCHEENDLGLKKAPPDLHGLFRHAQLPSGQPATDAAVEATVLKGKGQMPGFADRFDRPQLDALLEYLHTGLR